MMKSPRIHVAIYPVPTPPSLDKYYEVEELTEIGLVCQRLFAQRWPEATYDAQQVRDHFQSLQAVMNLAHHFEIEVAGAELDWEELLKEGHILLPQFVWTGCSLLETTPDGQRYGFDVIPLAYRETGFPFDLAVTESIVQQLFYDAAEALDGCCATMEALIWEKQLLFKPTPNQTGNKGGEEPPTPLETTTIDTQSLWYEEEIKRTQYAKERVKIANEKLELMMEQLELAMMYGGINHFDQEEEDQEAHWDKRLRISLREYSYLMQKAKYLEHMWQINGELVKKSEKMTVTGNQLIYERDQVNRIKETVTASEVYVVLDECQLIESRVKINNHPWFRKPYVKLMKMDYDSLLRKAAYFDVLQGENYLLENMQREQLRRKKPVQEAG